MCRRRSSRPRCSPTPTSSPTPNSRATSRSDHGCRGCSCRSTWEKPGATLDAFRNLWFHTGDAAPQDAEGNFYFVDRLGDRIRVRDGNISSFQVEDLLNQHEDVEMSAVFPVAGREGDEDDVAAYVVPRAGGQVEPERLLARARATMPKFMVPRHLRVVPDLPRTPTNKVEKYKLRAMLLAELQNAGDAG